MTKTAHERLTEAFEKCAVLTGKIDTADYIDLVKEECIFVGDIVFVNCAVYEGYGVVIDIDSLLAPYPVLVAYKLKETTCRMYFTSQGKYDHNSKCINLFASHKYNSWRRRANANKRK